MTYRHRGFLIEPKRDFGHPGHFIDGRFVRKGWVVVIPPGRDYAGCNAMPGATWSQTVRGAKDMVDAFIKARGRASIFWRIIHGSLRRASS